MILGLDTSSAQLSLALGQDNSIWAQQKVVSPRRHNETLLPALETLFHQARTSPQALTGVVVGLGPGSFTGIRIGIATALGLAQSLDIPMVGISSFLAIASQTEAEEALVLADARQNQFFTGWYIKSASQWQALQPEYLCTAAEIITSMPERPWQITGPETDEFYAPFLAARPDLTLAANDKRFPCAASLINLGQEKLAAGGMPREAIVPIYLRRPQAEERQIHPAFKGK